MNNKMETLLIFIYIVMTIVTILYTRMKTKEGKKYIEEVHGHMASIMFFHLSIISVLITIKPAFLNNIYISILNTLLSIMFSLLFYLTEKEDKKMLYLYNSFYLIFASILMSEIVLWMGNDTFVYAFMLIYGIFVCDLMLYNNENKNKLLIGYSVFSMFSLMVGGFMNVDFVYSILFSGLYGMMVIGYMYYDHDYLVDNKEKHHLIDSLKYFLDFEGMIVRTIDNYYLEK